jgi:hypothetical protein
MGLFGTKRIKCRAKKWTTIVWIPLGGMPAMFYVRMRTESGAPIAGLYEAKGFPGKPRRAELTEGEMAFERGWSTMFYSVRVHPPEDCVAEVD